LDHRVVIQALPPFLVVHSNAAFSRLTGIDSHKVVGQPIRSVLSLPSEGREQQAGVENSSSASGNPQSSDRDVTGVNRPPNVWPPAKSNSDSIERLVAASGFGRLHVVQVVTKHSQLVGKSVAFLKESPATSSLRKSTTAAASQNVGSNDVALASAATNNEQSLSSGGNASTVTKRTSCRASIAPIVSALDQPSGSSPPAMPDEENDSKRRKIQSPSIFGGGSRRGSYGGANNEGEIQEQKRRKVQGPDSSLPRRGVSSKGDFVGRDQRQLVTHYVVQLEIENQDKGNQGSIGSLSSHSSSVEARLLGLNKAEARHQRAVTSGANNAESSPAMMAREEEAESESTVTTQTNAVAAIG